MIGKAAAMIERWLGHGPATRPGPGPLSDPPDGHEAELRALSAANREATSASIVESRRMRARINRMPLEQMGAMIDLTARSGR